VRRARLLVFDDVIVGTSAVYSSTDFNDFLGQYDSLVLHAVVDNIQNASAITVQLQASADGRNWVIKNDVPEINNASVGAGQTSVAGVDPGTLGIGPGRVRLVVTIGTNLTSPVAHVRVWAEGRDIAGLFQPTNLPGCVLWLRADLGVTVSSGTNTVTNWADQSQSNDSNKNLTAGATGSPQLKSTDPNYANQATITLNGTTDYFTSGTWATSLPSPYTWIMVAHVPSTTVNVLIDSNDATDVDGMLVGVESGSPPTLLSERGSAISIAQAWGSPTVLLCEANDPNSTIYYNNLTVAQTTGSIMPGNFVSLTVGSVDIAASGGGDFWAGSIAELIAYSGILGVDSKAVLRSYFTGRYGIAIL
jgi:hypothetical protein